MEKKKRDFSQAINFLLTGLRIFAGESKAYGPHNVFPSVGHYVGPGALYYLLTNWLAYLYGRIQSPRPDVMPDRREGITRAAGFVFACIDTQAS